MNTAETAQYSNFPTVTTKPGGVAKVNQDANNPIRKSRLHYFERIVHTLLLRPVSTSIKLGLRTVKLLTWDPAAAALYAIFGYRKKSVEHLEGAYLKTLKTARDFLMIPSLSIRAGKDMVAKREDFSDDIASMKPSDYLKVPYVREFNQYSSYMHGCHTFDVIRPQEIREFAARSDAALNTVMASHFLKPDMMAINFGRPNVSAFVTEKDQDGSVQTVKVDAKSLRREEMSYHPTNGKIQSGVFLIPKNLPAEALSRFKEAAEKMQGRKDITCVNTNCRVLKEAGFSIEGVDMDGIVFPTTMVEHFLYRNIFYTDSEGNKHKVHFDILNTTQQTLEEHFKEVDTAVVATPNRHCRRNADKEVNRKIRGIAAQKLIAEEKERISQISAEGIAGCPSLKQRKVTVSVPSFLGDRVAKIWGRHTMYEVDLSDEKDQIRKAFEKHAKTIGESESVKLSPFPQEKPSLGTRFKRDLIFSGPVIRLLRRHMMGQADTLTMDTQDLFNHLKSTKGEKLNYVILDDKVVLSKVHANGNADEKHKKIADWALSKHALLAGRRDVYCSGEIWYDRKQNCFLVNNDSGTYRPSIERVGVVTKVLNKAFQTGQFGNPFKAVQAES